jgi:hypothetical protein
MDERDFDLLTRRLASGASRRALLRSGLALVGSIAGFGAAREAEAAFVPRALGQTCARNADCASRVCKQHHCVCGGPNDCPQPGGNGCQAAICSSNGQCSIGVNVGSPCDDGDACTTNDACQADGSCAGTPVTCAAIDQCHDAGTCDPAIGACTNPIKANGTSCNDDNACTTGDTCQDGVCRGGNPVVCAPLDQCHVAGTCDPATGQCSNPPADIGTPCDDGDACTTGDHCVGGVCAGTPTICQPVDDPAGCWNQPTCDPATGTCGQPTPKPQGTPCDDGNLCTANDVCDGAGTCAGTPKSCGGYVLGTCPQKCDPATGACVSGENGDSCTPSSFDACVTGVCQDGGCMAVPAPVGSSCAGGFVTQCMPGTGVCGSDGNCHPATMADGTPCSPLSSPGECQAGICKNGDCVVANLPDGTLCGDSAAPECSRNSCQAGVCADVSRLGQRCETQLHGCLKYTCQAGGCLDSGKTDDCASTISCGGHGTCTEELPGIGECVPILCDCCDGVCGQSKCARNDGTEVCMATNQVCGGKCFSEPVKCCGSVFAGPDQTCEPTEQCCMNQLGGYVCCPASAPCGINGCSPVGV